jgi:hypothetical protein
MSEFGWPTCATCGKPVDRVTETVDEFFGRVTYVVECHGARETVEVDLVEFERGRVRFGEAFRGPKALGP